MNNADEMSRCGKTVSGADSVLYRDHYDPSSEDLSTNVLLALDEVPEFDAESGDSVVYDFVDLDALDDLFSSTTDERSHVTFGIEDLTVTVTADGEITIRSDDGRPNPGPTE